MTLKKTITSLLFCAVAFCHAQEITLKKGIIMENLIIGDSLPESISLYLPSYFENANTWPVLYIFDLEGKERQALGMFVEAAEKEGFILATSEQLSDTLSVTDNALKANRMINWVDTYLPVQNNRSYTAGFGIGAKMAATVATVVPKISGLIMIGSSFPNAELLYNRKNFHFVGIVGHQDYNLLDMEKTLRLLNSNKYPNQLLVFDGTHQWPPAPYLILAMRYLSLDAQAKGNTALKDSTVQAWYREEINTIREMQNSGNYVRAYNRLSQAISAYRLHMPIDSLDRAKKVLRKDKNYRNQRRAKNTVRLNETLIREDYAFYLDEDVVTANYNNLGWWNYQMSELKKYEKSGNIEEKNMAVRLHGYLNALIEDHIVLIREARVLDRDALMFSWMLKTITEPGNYQYFLSIISESARIEDFGTALFYLEELLKNGFKDKDVLYNLEHTALLRISPDYNKIIAKYFKDPRYDPGEQ